MASEYIDIFGKFHAATVEGILAEAGEIKDVHFNKTQAELNLLFSGNATLSSVWASLIGNSGTYANSLIHAAHIPIGEGLEIDELTGRINATNRDSFFEADGNGGVRLKAQYNGLWAAGFITAGGVGSSGGGGGSASLLDMWVSLRDNDPNEDFYNWKINAGHLKIGSGLSIDQNGNIYVTAQGGVTSVAGLTGAITAAQLKTALSLGAAAEYGVGSVAQDDGGLVTGGAVYSAINSSTATLSDRIAVFEGMFELVNGNIHVKNSRGFYSDSFITAGGVGSSHGGGSASLLDMWVSLRDNDPNEDYYNWKINPGHIPGLPWSQITSGKPTTLSGYGITDAYTKTQVDNLIGAIDLTPYLLASVAAQTYATITSLEAVSARVSVLEGRTNWDDYFGIDQQTGAIFVKPIDANTPRGFYSLGYISAGGVGSSSGGGGGADLLDVWVSLRDNDPGEDFYNWKVNAGHLPLGSGLTVDANGNINVGTAGSVAWANVTGKPTTVSGYGITDAVTNASYNSTTKRIELKCGNVVVSYIDATAFIKDGMVSNVQVTEGYLVISFNTDAGQEDIRIPISDIFNADNYYDKTASDARFFLAANFTAANIVSTIGNTPVARASRLDGDTALSIWGVEYWANGVPKAVSARPGLYVAGTQVNINANKDTLLGVTAISNGLSSGSSDESRIEWDATNHAWHFYGGIYADTFVTAGGTNASGGGGGDVDLDRVWESLTNNIDFPNVKINIAHIPALAISDITGLQTALNAKQDTISDLATIRARADEGHVAYEGLPTISDCLLSLQSQLDSVASRDNFDELTAAAFYSDVAAVSSLYAETMSIGGADLSSTLSSLASRASDLETRASNLETRATNLEGRASTLEGYFTNRSANSALRLTTVSKTAWGQTYWTSGGIPDSVSGNMSDVGNISMSGSISGATTITASGLIKTTNYMQAARFYLSDSVYFVLDSNGVKLEGAGFYTDSFITAGGAGSSGGGGGDIDLDRVWESLTNNIDFPNTKINTAHIPDTASIYGYLKGNQTITLTGVVTGSGTTSITTSIADGALTIAKVSGLQSDLNTITTLLQSLQSQVDSVATRDMFDELTATNIYADVFTGTTAYFGTVYGALSGTASNATNADNADKLDGVHANGLFTELTTSAGSANLYITIGWTRMSGTVYAYYDSDGGVVASNMTTIGTALRSLQSQIDSVASRNGFDELTATNLYSDMLSVGANATIGGPLVVRGTAKIADDVTLDNRLTVYDDAFFHSDIYLYAGMALYLDQGGNNALYYDASEGTIRFTFDYASHFTDGIYSDSYITAGGLNASSDRRLKGNLASIDAEDALSVLMRLQPMEWVWNEKNARVEGKRGAGLVAQDVEAVLPFAVSHDTEYLALNYNILHAYEIAGLQSHEERIKALERENAELRRKLELINS